MEFEELAGHHWSLDFLASSASRAGQDLSSGSRRPPQTISRLWALYQSSRDAYRGQGAIIGKYLDENEIYGRLRLWRGFEELGFKIAFRAARASR
jgi:hypothetical protein